MLKVPKNGQNGHLRPTIRISKFMFYKPLRAKALKFGTNLSWVKLHGGSLDGFDSFTGSGAINEKLENFYFIQISSK